MTPYYSSYNYYRKHKAKNNRNNLIIYKARKLMHETTLWYLRTYAVKAT